jgi:hypothetical protein
LVKRGLKGVRLVISDAHEGLKQAISTVLSGSTWQRCRVHFMRNLLATVPHGAREAIAAIVRTIFAQPDHASAMTQLRKVAEGMRLRFPRAAHGAGGSRRRHLLAGSRIAQVSRNSLALTGGNWIGGSPIVHDQIVLCKKQGVSASGPGRRR